MPFFEIFMQETEGMGLWREFLVYFQRYQLPGDMTWLNKTDAIMFDVHTRNPHVPLHDPENKAGANSDDRAIDPRAKSASRNRYLFDRLLELAGRLSRQALHPRKPDGSRDLRRAAIQYGRVPRGSQTVSEGQD